MSVDPVEKAAAAGAAAPAAEATEAVPVAAPDVAAAAADVHAVDRVRAGETSLAEYIGAHVAEATRHLEQKLGPADLEAVRERLRRELEDDPVAQRLLREAAGAVPAPREP